MISQFKRRPASWQWRRKRLARSLECCVYDGFNISNTDRSAGAPQFFLRNRV